jgi:hypothetical protein
MSSTVELRSVIEGSLGDAESASVQWETLGVGVAEVS